MKVQNKNIHILSVLIFSTGVLLGTAFFGSAAWADLEAVFYGFDKFASQTMSALKCPVLMTTTETGTISATFTNTTDQPLRPAIRVDISNPGLLTIIKTTLSLAPGESQQLFWTVTSDDIVLERFIFAKVLMYAAYPLPAREGMCGILVIDLPGFTGSQIVIFAITASILSMSLGLALWRVSNRPLIGKAMATSRALNVLAGVILAGMIVGLLGWWMLGVILLTVTVLLIGVLVGRFVLSA